MYRSEGNQDIALYFQVNSKTIYF